MRMTRAYADEHAMAEKAEARVLALEAQMRKAIDISRKHKGYLLYADEPFAAALGPDQPGAK